MIRCGHKAAGFRRFTGSFYASCARNLVQDILDQGHVLKSGDWNTG
jgi:hypothetical protein